RVSRVRGLRVLGGPHPGDRPPRAAPRPARLSDLRRDQHGAPDVLAAHLVLDALCHPRDAPPPGPQGPDPMSPRARSVLASLLVAAACLSGASVQAFELGTQRVGAQVRYWSFTRGNDLRDPIVYWASRPLHVQLEYWDFVRGDDQFRPE